MNRVCILLFLTMGFTSTSLQNKAESLIDVKPKQEVINLDTISIKVVKLDSLLNELNKKDHEKLRN